MTETGSLEGEPYVRFNFIAHISECEANQIKLIHETLELRKLHAGQLVRDARQVREKSIGGCIVIKCSLPDFATYTITRHELGIQNRFSELKAEIVEPSPEEPHVVDLRR